jgi:Protein of unknown function (DUF2867)
MTNTTQVDVARNAREALPGVAYSDAFRTASPSFFTAEDWARAAFEPVPGRTFSAQQRVWRGVLQLRFGPVASPDHVAGWAIVENEPGRLVLSASSWHLDARLLFDAEPKGAQVTTLVRFRNPAGRAIWRAVGGLHRHAVPGILDAARKRLVSG